MACYSNEQQPDAKVMLNYTQNGPRRLGRPWKRLLDETTTGLLSANS